MPARAEIWRPRGRPRVGLADADGAAGGLRALRRQVQPKRTKPLLRRPPKALPRECRGTDLCLTGAREAGGRVTGAGAMDNHPSEDRQAIAGVLRTAVGAARAHQAATTDGRKETEPRLGRNQSHASTRSKRSSIAVLRIWSTPPRTISPVASTGRSSSARWPTKRAASRYRPPMF